MIRQPTCKNLVHQMLAAPTENIKHFKSKIAGLKRARKFVPWGESANLAHELNAFLADIADASLEPRIGAELIISFYETDKGTFGRCDDSSGHVGDVYRYDARDLFLSFAKHCEDKDWLEKLVVKLNHEDDYGVRDTLIDCAAECLPEPNIRSMIETFQTLSEKEHEDFAKRHWLYRVESLARQIKDAPLFEKTRIAAWGRTPTAACIDIGRVYLESGDAPTALSWLERIPENEAFKEGERDKVLLDIHSKLGNVEKQKEIALRIFRRHRSAGTLQELMSYTGEDNRDAIITGEVAAIFTEAKLSLTDAAFLIELGLFERAEDYLLERSDQLNGDYYYDLLPLAENLATAGRHLSASMVYRTLLDSILRRARSKAYPHGVRYLRKLDLLAKLISDWQDFEDHAHYSEHLREKHGRKKTFWARYD